MEPRSASAALLQSRLLLVKGVVQREGLVVHVVAGEARDLSHKLAALTTESADGALADTVPIMRAFRSQNFH